MTAHRSRMTLPPLVFALALTLVGIAPVHAADPGQSLPPAAGAADETATPVDDELVVRYARGTGPVQRRAVARDHGLTVVAAGNDGRTDVVVAQGRSVATTRRQLAADPRVEAVAPNHRRELADDVTDEPLFDQLWGLHNTGQTISGSTTTSGVKDIDIDAPQALRLGLGRSAVVVAVIDDGVDFSHADLVDRAWTNPGEAGAKATNGVDDDGNGYVDDVHGWDFCNDDASVHDEFLDGHGTHVAGTIAASRNGQGVVGVAPGVKLMALKFIDGSGSCGTDAMAVAAIDYAASFGVRIINASWGGSQPSPVLDAAIAESGALVVAAAGNWGLDMDDPGGPRFYPASSTLPNIISVAAVGPDGRRPSFSNYGTTAVDIAAPGTNILSTYPRSSGCQIPPCYAWSAGTSMAAPHVTGIAALAGSANTWLLDDPVRLRSRILRTGQALSGGTSWTATGRIANAFRAVDATPPVVGAPYRFAVKTGTVVGSTSVSAVVSWPAARDATTWVTGYGLRRKGPSGWTTITERASATSAPTKVAYKSEYVFQLTAKDAPGNVSAPVDSPTVIPRLHSEGSSLASWSRSWRTISSSPALGGKVRTTSTAGASMSFGFTGRSFALVAPKGPTRGSIKVYVDGVLVKTVDLYRSSTKARMVVFSTSWTAKATHKVRVVVVGSKRVDIDGFVVVR